MENLLNFSLIKYLVCNVVFLLLFFYLFRKLNPKKNDAKVILIIYIFTIVFFTLLYYLKYSFNFNHLFIALLSIYSLICIITIKLLKIDNYKIETFFALILIFGTYLSYVSYTPHFARQHDSRSFFAPQYGGHFGYIGYIFSNNALPNMNPTDYWCFYNPPLFYVISATVLKVLNLFTIEIGEGFEFLQLLSSIYAIIFIYYIYKILNKLNVKKCLLFVLLFVGLSPAMVFLSGSLNNDILSIMLSTIALYYAIDWYENDKLSNLIIIAFSIGLAMMTKISSALIAIVIAIIFLVRIIENLKNTEEVREVLKKYIINFSIFAIIALPLGLWFPIKNYIKYDIPFTYIQSVDLDNDSNISEYSVLERLFKIENNVLKKSNEVQMDRDNKEYNIFITTIKSFLLDERIEVGESSVLKTTIDILLYLSIFGSILFVINYIYLICYSIITKSHDKWLYIFSFLFIIEIVSYTKFCFDFPFTFTMNFRYIVPTLICFGYIMGKASENNKNLLNINSIFLGTYSALCLVMFSNLL